MTKMSNQASDVNSMVHLVRVFSLQKDIYQIIEYVMNIISCKMSDAGLNDINEYFLTQSYLAALDSPQIDFVSE